MNMEPFRNWRWNQHMNRDLDQALAEVEREIHVRVKCFDKWVSEGKLSWMDAFDRMERAISAVKHLRDYQTILKVQALQDLQPGEQQPHPTIQEWAQQTHDHVNNTVQFTQAPPTTAPEAPETNETRKNCA